MRHPAAYFREHLLVATTLAFMGGIALSPSLHLLARTHFFLLTTLGTLFVVSVALYLFNSTKLIIYTFLPLATCIGWYHGDLHLQAPADPQHIYNRIVDKTDVVVVGTMTTMAEFDGRMSRVTIAASSIRLPKSPELQPAKGNILLRLQGPWPSELSPGDTLAIRAELKRPNSFRTPGVFDYARYLAQKGIWVTGFVRSPLLMQKLEEHQSIFHSLRYLPERLRTRIGREVDAAVPAEISGVYRAILIGDRSHVNENTLEIFKGSGTMHILAISGLHVAIIGTLLYAGIFWLLSRSEQLLLRFTLKKWAAFASLPVLLGYGLLAGMNTPVLRALIMSAIVIVAICTNRQKSPGPLLAFAALLILSLDPLQLFTVSFQLSFAAITGILFLLPILKKVLSRSNQSPSRSAAGQRILIWAGFGLSVSLVANLVTAPIALHSFNRFSVLGPLANLIIEPLICLWSLTAGFLAIPFFFIQPALGSCLLQLGGLGLDAALRVATFFSSFTWSTLWLPTPPLWLVLLYYFCLVVCTCFVLKNKKGSLPLLLVLSGCIVLFIYPLPQQPGGEKAPFRLSYLDVGQGTATLLEYPSGFRVLIDGGGSSQAATTVGERVIAPFLWQKGIRKIDAIAITHPDADHYNGLDFIIRHFSPDILWVRDRVGHDYRFRRLIRLAEKMGVSVLIPKDGDLLRKQPETLRCVANISGSALGPAANDPRDRANSGLVFNACARQICALFPGDIGRAREHSLVDQGFPLKADVLLAPHHGSITSNSSEFLAAVSPKYLLVSAGHSSKGYFPHKGLAGQCRDRQIDLFTTAGQGTLQIIVKKDGMQIYGYKRVDDNPLSSYKAGILTEQSLTPR